MKRIFVLLSTITLSFLSSCIEIEPSGLDEVDYVKWTYDLNSIDNKEIKKASIPVFDEANNGYYLLETDNTSASDINNRNDVWLLALRGDSTLNWKIKVSDDTTDPADENYIIYAEGKVIVCLQLSMICINPTDGSIIWSKPINRLYWKNSLSVANNKLFYIDQSIPNKLKGLDLSNSTEICALKLNSNTNEDVRGDLTIICGNKLFVSTSDINNSGQWLSKIFIYDITSISDASIPVEYLLPFNYYPKHTMAATSAGDVLFYMKNEGGTGPNDKYLVSINSSGIENWKKIVSNDADQLYVDSQNNIYCLTSTPELIKYSSSGVLAKETGYNYATFTNFEILENNTFFGKTSNELTGEEMLFTLFNLSDGSIKNTKGKDYPYTLLEGASININKKNELRSEENSEFAGSYQTTVDREGNLIGISRYKIYCIKNFDQKLQSGSWAKKYANYGNTNAR